jgi:hypothetical protein
MKYTEYKIFEFSLNGADVDSVISDMDEKIRRRWSKLSNDEKLHILQRIQRSVEKGFESGLTGEWAYCLMTALDSSDEFENLVRRFSDGHVRRD